MNINGYTLKAIKEFTDKESIGFSANLYHNGKRIGEASGTAVVNIIGGGCEIDICLDPKFEELHENVDEDLVDRLYFLHLQEESYKDMIKKMPDKALVGVTLFPPTYELNFYLEFYEDKNITEEAFVAWYNKSGNSGKIAKVDIFTSLEDFNIQDATEPENLQDEGMKMT
jgi:hypothetical protein